MNNSSLKSFLKKISKIELVEYCEEAGVVDEYEDILIRRFCYGKSLLDIACFKNISPATVERRLDKALRMIEGFMRKKGIESEKKKRES